MRDKHFCIHRRHLDFIREWRDQIAKVLPAGDTGVVDSSLYAYFMSDESVLSSLLVFSRSAPPLSTFRLNRDPLRMSRISALIQSLGSGGGSTYGTATGMSLICSIGAVKRDEPHRRCHGASAPAIACRPI